MGDWIETYTPHEGESFSFVSQINHPDHSKDVWSAFLGDHTVMTIERESTDRNKEFMVDNTLWPSWTTSRPYNWRPVYIVRSFKNWLASVVKAHEKSVENDPNNPILSCYNVHQDIEKYRSYLGRLGICDFAPPDFSPYTIFYDSWVKSVDYRKEICRNLNLRYTNCGFRDVPQNCGGSSFDGLGFDGKANEMRVLTRWKEYENNEGFMKTLDHYSDIVEMSDRVCGV